MTIAAAASPGAWNDGVHVRMSQPPEPTDPTPADRPPDRLATRLDVGRAIRRYVPIVVWLPVYDRANLRPDAIAGVVSWGVMVPVAMAYAGLAGMPPETGLVTAFAAMAAYAVFGTSRHLKVTASSSVAIMSASVVVAIAAGNTSNYIPLTAALAILVGVILVVAGAARLGFLSQFLAASVVTGFVIGLAVTITIGQLPALLGIPAVSGTILEKCVAIAQSLDEVDPYTAIIGIGSAVGILILRRVNRQVPGALVALIVGIVASTLLDLPEKGVAVVGDVATGVPFPSIPNVPFGDLVFLITGAFGIVFLALAESIGAARSFGARHGYEIDPNQELIALGAANAGAGLFGGFVVDASLSQSATGEAAGNVTQVSSLVTAGLVLATAVVLAPLFANLPLSVLAAIVITSVLGLVNIAELQRYLAWKRTDFLLAMTALGGVVFTTALTGMAIAVTLSLMAILYQASRPYIAVLGRIPGDPPVFADAGRHHRASRSRTSSWSDPNVPLTFVNADIAKDHIIELIEALPTPPRAVGHGHRRDVRPRRGHHGHAQRPARRPRGQRHRTATGPGPGLGPRPDATDGTDDDHRRGPLLPVRRGGRRRAVAVTARHRTRLRPRREPLAPPSAAGRTRRRARRPARLIADHPFGRDGRTGDMESIAASLATIAAVAAGGDRGGGYHRSWRQPAIGGPATAIERPPAEAIALPTTDDSPGLAPDASIDPARADRDARRAEDAALLARIVDRDEAAVESLYARYSGPLYSLAYRVTGADRFAQDVVQEVFIALWKDAARFDPSRGSVGPWLFSLARHKAIDLVRREANVRKRTADVDLEFEVAPEDVDRTAWLNLRRDRVREAVASLTEAQRTALELAFFGGLTHVEVAERLGIPLGTAKTRIRSALLRLREVLGNSLSEADDDAATIDRWTTGPTAS